jgi:REP element-mobilizing transposase RayT
MPPPYNADARHRRSIRLRGYDYSRGGAYFITVCTHQRECLLGEVVDEQIRLSPYGQIILEDWLRTADLRSEARLDTFVVMPNHFHTIVMFVGQTAVIRVGAHGRAPLQAPPLQRPPRSLGALVAGFKSASTKRVNAVRGKPGLPLWQRNYYGRIIRSEGELSHVRGYIASNPVHWDEDEHNPSYLRPVGSGGRNAQLANSAALLNTESKGGQI